MKDQATRDEKTLVIATALVTVSVGGLVVALATSAAGPAAGLAVLAVLLVLRQLLVR